MMLQTVFSKKNNPLWEWGLGPSANRRQTRCLIAAGSALVLAVILSVAGVIIDIPELHIVSLNLLHISLLIWTSATEERFDSWCGWLGIVTFFFGAFSLLWAILIGPNGVGVTMGLSILFYMLTAVANGARMGAGSM